MGSLEARFNKAESQNLYYKPCDRLVNPITYPGNTNDAKIKMKNREKWGSEKFGKYLSCHQFYCFKCRSSKLFFETRL